MAGSNNGSSLGPNAFILALLAILGIGAPALRTIKGPALNAEATPQLSPVTRKTVAYSHSAAELLGRFFDANSGEPTESKPWRSDSVTGVTDSRLPQAGRAHEFTISFLIETVPAFTSAALRHEFDSYLNAIQMAAGRAGYVLDSFDVPPHAEEENRGTRYPAVLLFRNDGRINKGLLVVFLVDETPTSGINKTVLRDALDQIAWLSGWKGGAAPPPQDLVEAACKANGGVLARSGASCIADHREIRIVGPTFSGSAVSLRTALMRWLAAQKFNLAKITILSGTATAIGGKLNLGQNNPVPNVEFHSVRIADSAIWEFVRPFVHAQGDSGHPTLAVLSDNTSYGGASTGRDSGILRITFPVHISDLRKAAGSTDQTATALNLGRHDIPIADENQQPDKDVIPLFSGRSAVYDELVLEKLLSTLNAERIRYIGVVATDVEDLVFLVHEIRRACPNTVVFTTSADLRYIHSDVNPDLLGMLVFSTYPLFGWNQTWTYPFTGGAQRIQFPGEDAEGVFNATIAQLNHPDEMEEYGVPFATNRGSASRAPGLWVGVVGRDSIWPIAFQVESGVENLYEPAASGVGRPSLELANLYPLAFQVAFPLICVGCLIPAAGLLRPQLFTVVPPSPGSGRSWTDALFGDAVFPEFHQERWMRVGAFLGALLIAMVVALGYFLLPLRSASLVGGVKQIISVSLPVALITLFTSLVTIPAILAAMAAALHRIRGRLVNSDQMPAVNLMPTGAQFALLGTVVGLALGGTFIIAQWRQPPGFALLNFIRAANLENGVSPLTPLIFLGIANLCLIGGDLWRLRLIEDCRVKPPFLNFEAGAQSFRGTDALEARVIHFLECSPWELPGTWLLLALVVAAFSYFACSRGLPVASIDGWSFNLLFFLSAAFIYFYFSILLLRFVWIWRELHRLLRRLYWHPTRGAYSLLRAQSLPESSGQAIRLIEPRPSLTALEFCLQCARQIFSLLNHPGGNPNEQMVPASPEVCGALGDAIRSAESELAAVLAAETEPNWYKAIKLRMKAQAVMAHLSCLITTMLEPTWRLAADRPLPSLAEREQKMIEYANLFVASRVVDLMRQVFPQMRVLSGSAMAGLLAMMLAVSTYPFVQRDLILWISWIVLLAAIAIGVTIFVQIGRSRIISMLAGTTPGRFNWDSAFTVRILMFGIIPILTLLGAQYPNALGGIISWIGRVLGGAPSQ